MRPRGARAVILHLRKKGSMEIRLVFGREEKSLGMSKQGMSKAALMLVVGTLLSRIFGLVRETVIAYQFGATAQTDAYLVALIVPLAISGIIVSALSTAFIPVFTEYRLQSGEKEAWKIASAVINLAIIILLVATVSFFLASPLFISLLAPGLAAETKAMAIQLARLLAPAIIITGIVGLATAVLHSYRHFTYPIFAGFFHNVGIIGGALLLGGFLGINGLAVGGVAGLLANMLMIFIPFVSQRKFYQPTFDGLRHPGTRKIGLLLIPFLVGFATGQINMLVDRILASWLVEGSIAALSFADRLIGLPLGIFAGAVTTAAYPYLSEQAAVRNITELRRTVSEGLRILWFIVFPLGVGLKVLGEPIIRLLFERGAFDVAATGMTAIALFYYALGIYAHAANALLSRVFFALQDTSTPIKLGLLSTGLNIVLNLILVRFMAHGGLALATSISGTVLFLMLAVTLRRRLGHMDGWRLLRSISKFAAASVLMGLAVAAAYRYSAIFFNPALFSHLLLQTAILILLGGAIYFAAAALLRTEEPGWLLRRMREMVSQKNG
ncbi:MAG: putative lipid II flippase MurJ [Syntrophomonadaceae bacterium]|nr:putative lipid II flippase MurJ [Bacillota bacterium]